ncbi:MAG: hypothetical protein AUH84_07305 [Thaumarchaeota archaeon 13_1_40CM_4_38_7]|nr:MAG: hypothetical protein AUH84_07305 [Thaumarchaeota archaeon 13_1_40CM_4_38_7]OLC93465.1 MAG: hypothetical protein AUI92_02795 [Thaumarchaeota archaeon 13_1_40CM_3_38_6]
MRTRFFVLPVFAAFVFFLSYSIHDVAAFSVTLNGTDACTNAPISGTWDSFYHICTVNDLTINPGDSLIITGNQVELHVVGTLNNSGALTVDYDPYGGYTALINRGTIDNTGTMTNNNYFTNYGTINNTGLISNGITSKNIGTILNYGVINNKSGGTINNYYGINSAGGTINNFGTINSYSGLANYLGGTINNKSELLIYGGFGNLDGTVNNSGTIDNHSILDNGANNGGTSDNHSYINNTGTINNYDEINNNPNPINYPSTIITDDIITNYGTIHNEDIINNDYVIQNFATIYNNPTGEIGHLINGCLGSINPIGIISGNPTEVMCSATNVIYTQQGSFFIQQSTTGVNVTVSGASVPCCGVSVTSVNYGTAQPAATGPLSIDQIGFYDVKIIGISDGTALVCISNPNITMQTNVMQYWFNGIWNDASNPTVSGNIICGSIPVSALNGTPIVIGTHPALLGSIIAPVDPIRVNTQFTTSDTFTDDTDDTHTASWNWGDSTTSTGTVTESGGSGSIQNTHTYTTPGVYTITLTVNNSDGATSTAYFQFVVAYDPNGGFVTGGGWINSPQGAYTANPSLIGKATFGFNSKYQNGATVPTGNTEFNFKVANLNFHSTSYDWLVIAGAKAQYKGTGTINGAGSYKFILTTIDGEINGGGGIDKFRMKIIDINGGLVYDNLLNTPDSSDPTTVLGGGDIIIHKS